ncbi:MAG: DUF6133 family protein [Oscillospiraceae bacterium]
MKLFNTIKNKITSFAIKTQVALANNKGEGFVDSGVKILIAVVIGALLLGGLYVLFGETILPTLTTKIKELFNFAGK